MTGAIVIWLLGCISIMQLAKNYGKTVIANPGGSLPKSCKSGKSGKSLSGLGWCPKLHGRIIARI